MVILSVKYFALVAFVETAVHSHSSSFPFHESTCELGKSIQTYGDCHVETAKICEIDCLMVRETVSSNIRRQKGNTRTSVLLTLTETKIFMAFV